MNARAKAMAVTALCSSMWMVVPTGRAHAQESREEARTRFNRGIELFDEAAYAQAVVEFQRAYELTSHFAVLYNLGMSYVALGRPVEAVDALRRYLEQGAATVPDARRTEVAAEIAKQQARIAHVTIDAAPAGATVRVDDVSAGTSPLREPVRVGIGRHEVEVSFEGHRTARETIVVAGEERRTLRIHLEPISVAAPTPGSGTGAGAAATAQVPIRCAVPDVEVLIDGRARGKTPLEEPLLALPGKRSLRFTRPGYADGAREVYVVVGPNDAVDCGLRALDEVPAAVAASLTIRASESDAEPRVDGAPLPENGVVPAGRHVVEIAHPGFESWSDEVQLTAGQDLELEVQLTPRVGAEDATASGDGSQRTIGYVLGGAGIAAGIAASVTYMIGGGKYDDWKKEDGALGEIYMGFEETGLPPDDELDAIKDRQSANNELQRSVDRLDTVSVALAIGGGALLVGGAVLLLTAGGDEKAPTRAGLHIHPAPDGVELGFRF